MTKKRILVVGAGCAGMSCADQLSEHSDRFDVTLIDSVDRCGGQAFSIEIDKEKYGTDWLNQGVQGGSPIFYHTFRMFNRQETDVKPVNLHVSFGKNEHFWTNAFPTKLLEKHQYEIKKFLFVLKLISYFKIFFLLLPIKVLMKLFFFSSDFTNYLILPTVALFLGTGNETPNVPSIILERLFHSPTYGMWYKPDQLRLISNLPSMVVFPKLTEFYQDWKSHLEKRHVNVRLSTELVEVIKRTSTSVTVKLKSRHKHDTPVKASETSSNENFHETIEEYDQLVFSILPDQAKLILGKNARWIERFLLGRVKLADDITVTHNDTDYMEKYYTNRFDASQAVEHLNGRDESAQINYGKTSFKPMYYIKEYLSDPSKIEMSFDCTNYQSQFPKSIPFSNHVFQTIFLNKKDSEIWTKDEIAKEKIIREDWWHQICHSWTHYLFVVPWIWLLNRSNTILFAGSWTMVNAHELASISGLAAAYRIGANYPEDLLDNPFATLAFKLYLLLSHGIWFSKKKQHSH